MGLHISQYHFKHFGFLLFAHLCLHCISCKWKIVFYDKKPKDKGWNSKHFSLKSTKIYDLLLFYWFLGYKRKHERDYRICNKFFLYVFPSLFNVYIFPAGNKNRLHWPTGTHESDQKQCKMEFSKYNDSLKVDWRI
jgi:hypothetical protein